MPMGQMNLRFLAALVGTAALALLASACVPFGSGAGPSTQATRLSPCPSTLSKTKDFVAVYTDSASERAPRIEVQREKALDAFVETAASCSGHLTVVFDPGLSVTSVLWSGTPYVAEGSPIAFERKSAAYARTTVLPRVTRALHKALQAPAPEVATPDQAFAVLAEVRTGGPLDALVLSSFVEDDATIDLNKPLTAASAEHLAAGVPVPRLAHAQVSIEGVGTTADPTPAPTDWLGALRTFAGTLCARTKARCRVTTEVVGT